MGLHLLYPAYDEFAFKNIKTWGETIHHGQESERVYKISILRN